MEKDKIESTVNQADFQFVGWIPCVSGHLDFGLINVGLQGGFTNSKKKDPKNFCCHYSKTGFRDSHEQRVVIQSWVDWKDRVDSDGDYRVCVVTEANHSDDLDKRELTGCAIVYRKKYETLTGEHRSSLLDAMHDLNNYFVESRNSSTESWNVSQEKLNGLWDVVVSKTPTPETSSPSTLLFGDCREAKPDIYRVDFKIQADGITLSSFTNLRGQSIEVDGNTNILNDEDRFIVCRHVFYYLKYSLHVHKHHEHQADALTSIVPFEKNAGLKLIGQIKRELSAIKRTQLHHQRLHHSSEAIGILGYINSLLIALKDKEMISESQFDKESGRCNNMEKSFKGQSARIDDCFKKRSHIASSTKQVTMMMLSYISLCLIAFINLFKKNEDVNPDSSKVLSFLAESQSSFIYLPFVMLTSILICHCTTRYFYRLREEKISFWKVIYKLRSIYLYCILIFPPLIVVSIALFLSNA